MADQLILKVIEPIAKRDGSGTFWKAHFEGGRKATFFSESLHGILSERLDQLLTFELRPGKEGWDPSIEQVSDGEAVLWSAAKSRGGGRPLLSQEQYVGIVGALNNIAAALRALPGISAQPATTLPEPLARPPASVAEPVPAEAPEPNRSRLLNDLHAAGMTAFGSTRLWEAWLKSNLAYKGKEDLESLGLRDLVTLITEVKTVASQRGPHAEAS